jgi:hypothetical protein
VVDHQPLHLAVVAAAPVRAGEERPAYLDLISRQVVAEEPRRADDFAIARVIGDQCAAGVEGILEELAEPVGLGALLGGVLLPDAWVGGDGPERVEVGWPEGAELEEFALEGGV